MTVFGRTSVGYLALLAIVAIMVTFMSCQKDAPIESLKDNNGRQNLLNRAPGGMGLTIDYGTRKRAKKNREHDEEWGTDFDNGNICQGKGMCLHTTNAIELSDSNEDIIINGDDVIEGGLLLDNDEFIITENSGRWNLYRDLEGAYFVEIGSDDILPATKEAQFGDGFFHQEFDYILPTFISNYFNVEEIILHKGNHPITEDENGTIKFYL